ncbi:MAG TPA: ATP-binding protein, partial [Polyangiaceae bacterium]
MDPRRMEETQLTSRSWTGTHVCLEEIGGSIAICTLSGMLVGATPSARAVLRRLEIPSTIPAQLPESLWGQLATTPMGEATQWRPPSATTDACLGCTRYALGGSHVLLFMREVSEKQLALVQRLHQQRLEATGRLVASIAHDLRAPLASIVFNSEVLTRGTAQLEPHVLLEILGEIGAASKRLRRAIDGLLDFARLGPPVVSNVGVREVIDRATGLLRSAVRDGGHEVRVEVDDDAMWARGNPLVIEQIIVNLIVNAIEGTHGPTRIAIAARGLPDTSYERIEIAVIDDGPGIPSELRERIFEPFFTTKPNGSGLGLTTAREAANDLGGDLRL